MPIFEAEGKRYNVQDAHIAKFAQKYPEATTIMKRDGQKYKVKASDIEAFNAKYPNNSELHPQSTLAELREQSKQSAEQAEKMYNESEVIYNEDKPYRPAFVPQPTQAPAEGVVQAEANKKVEEMKSAAPDFLQPMYKAVDQAHNARMNIERGMQDLETPTQREYDEKMESINKAVQMGTITPQQADVQRKALEIGQSISSTPTDEMIRRTNARGVAELSKELDEKIAYKEQQIAKEQAEKGESFGDNAMRGGITGMPLYARTGGGRLTDQEYNTLIAAKRSLKDAQAIIDEADHQLNAGNYTDWQQTGAAAVGRGMQNKLFDVRTWDMGVSDAMDMTALNAALDKADNGEELTEAEKALLDAKAYEMAVNAYFGSYVGMGYTMGQGAAESIPFMLEFAINPLSAVGKTAQNKLVRYALKKYGKGLFQKKLKYNALKYGTRLVGDLVGGGTGMTLTSSLPRTIADATSRTIGQIKPEFADYTGRAEFGGTEGGVSAGRAAYEAIAAGTFERFSEMMSYYTLPAMKPLTKAAGKVVNKFTPSKVTKVLDDMSHNLTYKQIQDFFKRTQWHGVFGESLEEVGNNVLNAAFVGDMNFGSGENGVLNPELNKEMFFTVALTGGYISTIATAGYGVSKYKAYRGVKRADEKAADYFGEDWATLKPALSTVDNNALNAYEAIEKREDYTDLQKAAAKTYLYATAVAKGATMADLKRKTDTERPAEDVQVELSYDAGRSLYTPEEMNRAKMEYELQLNNIRRIYALGEDGDVDAFLGDDPLTSIRGSLELGGSEEEAQAKLDYLNAKATYDGMLDQAEADVNDKVARSNALIDRQVNKTMNGIQQVTLNNGEEVFVIDGVIAANEDGSIDRENTDKDVIYLDANGKAQFTSRDNISSAKPFIDVATYKQQNANNIIEQSVAESAAKIDGVLAMNVGDKFYVMDDRGLAHQAQVTANFEDGNVAISLDNGKPQQMTREKVQAMANAFRAAEYQAEKAEQAETERKDMQQAEVQLQQEEDEKTQAEEQTQQTEQPETATSRVPVGENGNLLYEQADSDTAWDALVEQAKGNEATAQKIADMSVKKAQKALDELKDSSINENMSIEEMLEAENAHNDAVAAAEANLNKWKEIASTPQRRAEEAQRVAETEAKAEAMQERIDKANETISEEQKKAEQRMRMSNARAALQNGGRYQSENAELGAPIDFADFVMRAIATGGVRFIWGNNPRTGTRGLGSHTGFGEQERRKRIGFLSNAGMYPEVAAEQLLSSYADEIGYDPNIDTSDALSTILDVVMSYTTPKEMMEAAQARHAEAAAKEADAAEIDAEEAYYRMMAAEHNMTVLEYMEMEAAREEIFIEKIKEREKDKDKIDAIFVELYLEEDYDNKRRNQSLRQGVSGQIRSGASNEGGSNVLPSAQSDNTRAAQRSAEGQGATAQISNEGGSDLSASQTLGEPKSVANKMLSEEEYINQEVAKAIPEGMTLEEFEETEEYIDTFNAAADNYPTYVKGLADSGELQQMFDSATIGEQIAIRKNVEATSFDIHDLIDTKKNAPAKKTKKTRGQELMENLGLVYTKENDSTPQMRAAEGGQPGSSLSRAMNILRIPLRKRINMWSKKVGVSVEMVEDFNDVTSKKARINILAAQRRNRRVTGWVEDGKVYLYMPMLRDIDEIDETYIHEVVAHKGMDAMLGKEEYRKFCLDVFDQVMSEADRKTYLNYEGVSDLKDETEKKAKAADEYIAHLSEGVNLTKSEATLWNKIVDLFRKMLEAIGFPQNISKRNIEDMIRKSYDNLLKGNIGESTDGKGTQFRVLKDEAKSLVGIHNISEEKLQKAINMGGLANPSVAVLNIDKQDHSDYGAISLILPKDMVDARLGRNAGTWAGDAWTPTYPSVIKQISDKKDVSRFYKDINKMSNEMRNKISLDFNSFLEGRDANSFYYWYLFENGNAPELQLIPAKYPIEITEKINEATNGRFSLYQLSPEQRAACVDAYIEYQYQGDRAAYERDLQDKVNRLQGFLDHKNGLVKRKAQEDYDSIKEYGFDYDQISSFLRDVEYYANHSNQVDVDATIKRAQDYVVENNLEDDYQSWRSNLEQRYGIKEYIFDGYTNSGKKKYLPHTLENASKWMKKQGREGAVATFPSFGTFVAIAIPRMTSLSSIKKKQSLLGNTEQDFEEFKSVWEDVYYSLGQKLQPNAQEFDDYGWWRLIEAAGSKNPQEHIKRQYGIELSKEDTTILNNMLDAIRNNYPARYFETKFERPVNLSEFVAAVVPNDIPADLEENLRKSFLSIYKYDPKQEGSRRAATLDATNSDNIRFRVSSDTPIEGYTNNEVVDIISAEINNTFAENDIDNADIAEVWLHGSRLRGDAKENSDLDAVLFYRGDVREDDLFNIIAEKDITIDDVKVDVNPIRIESDEDITRYKQKSQQYDAEKLSATNNLRFRIQDEATDAVFSSAKEEFEETEDWGVTGWLLPDGTQLSFADEGSYERDIDHRAIGRAYNGTADERWQYLQDFEKRGGIRISANYGEGTIEMMVAPTPEQKRKIVDFVRYESGNISIDFMDDNYNTNHSVYYDNANPSRISADIDRYFEEGIKPSGNARFRVTPAFYSNAERAVENIKQEKATPEQWLKMIEKNGGLKAGEDKWLGLSDWLKASNKKTLTKQEVLDYIKANEIQIEEVVYGSLEDTPRFKELRDEYKSLLVENDYNNERTFEAMVDKYGDDFDLAFEDWGNDLHINSYYGTESAEIFLDARDINDTRIQYTTDGLNNKREIALVVPTIESWNESDEIHFGDAGNGRAVAWVRFGETTDADGNRVLVIDEVQSKRHQEGREKGYAKSEANNAFEIFREQMMGKYGVNDKGNIYKALNTEDRNEFDRLRTAANDEFRNSSDVPSAPFEKNWAELAMKRMLRYAAENGFDKVAWTTGEQQAERYDISKSVDNIKSEDNNVEETADGTLIVKNITIYAGGSVHNLFVDANGIVRGREYDGKKLSDIVGKPLAEKLMEKGDFELEGEGLRIGGEGMKAFYDKMIPSFMNKYGKKWGVKVGEVTMPNLEENNTMHSVDVTPAMRESVMQGQPMFRVTQDKARFDELQKEYDALDKNDEAALNAWRDKKMGVVRDYLEGVAQRFGMKPDIVVFNGADEAQMKEAYDRLAESYRKSGATPPSYEAFKEHALDQEVFATYYRGGDIITNNISTKDHINTKMRYAANLFHEVAHHHANILYNAKEFAEIWNDVKRTNLALVERINTSRIYKNKSNSSKGNEFLAHSIAAIVREYQPIFQQFVRGEGNVTADNVVAKLGYKQTKTNFALTEILNRIKDEYQESRSRDGGNISRGVGGNRPNRVPRRVLQNNVSEQERGGGNRERGRGFVLTTFLNDVSQNGLREVVGNDNYNEFFNRLYGDVDIETRRAITDYAIDNNWDYDTGINQYLASLAENENTPLDNGVRESFMRMLEAAGVDAEGITDNDIRYMLWRNTLKDNGALSVAEDVVMKQKLGVDNAQPTADTSFRVANDSLAHRVKNVLNEYDNAEDIYTINDVADHIEEIINEYDGNESTTDIENILNDFRDAQNDANRWGYRWDSGGEDAFEEALRLYAANGDGNPSFRVVSNGRSIRDKYEKRVNTGKGKLKATAYNFQEAMQDEMLSLKIYQQLLEEMYGVNIPSYLNVYNAENSLSSRNKVEMDRFVKTLYEDMMQQIDKLIKAGATEQEVRDYVISKSGIERSIEFTVRDYINEQAEATLITEKEAKEQLDEVNEMLRNNAITPMEADARRQRINRSRNTKKYDAEAVEGMRKLYEEKRDALRERLNRGEISFDEWALESRALAESYTGKEVTDKAGLTGMVKRLGIEDKYWFSNARKIVEEFEAEYDNKINKKGKQITKNAISSLWSAIDKCNNATLKKLYDTGMISKDSYNKLQKQFMFYVPMSGFTEDVAEDVYSYIGNETGAFTPPLKKAGGRLSESDDPFAIIGNKMQSAILQGNRNAMKIKFLNLHRQFPTDLITEGRFWEVKQPDGSWQVQYPEIPGKDASAEKVKAAVDEFNERMKRLKESGDARIHKDKTNIPYKITRQSHENQHQITVRFMGEPITMFVNGNPQLAKAINGKLGKVPSYFDFNKMLGEYWQKAKRISSATKTSWNPNFIAPNVLRDIETGVGNVFLEYGIKDAGRLIVHFFPALGESFMQTIGLGSKGKIGQHFEEFIRNGGETGYSHIDNIDAWKKKARKRWDRISKLRAIPRLGGLTLEGLGNFISAVNGIFEDATRFAAYRMHRTKGESIVDSIKAAKDISTNFNKKGADGTEGIWGFTARFLRNYKFLFFNPMVQGVYRFGSLAKQNKGKASVLVTLPILAGFFNAMWQDLRTDDEDDEKKYLNQNPFTRRTHLMIFTGEGYVKIPLTQILRELYAVGDIAYCLWRDKISKSQAALAIFNTLRSIVNLEGQSSLAGEIGDDYNPIKAFLPQVADPVTDVVFNEDFTGSPIYRDASWDQDKPQYQRVYQGTWQWLINISRKMEEFLVDVEGSRSEALKEYDEGVSSKKSSMWMNPGVWQHLLESTGGGLLTTITDGITSLLDWEDEDARVDRNRIPIARRFYSEPSERTAASSLSRDYYNITNIEQSREQQRYDNFKAATEGKADKILEQLQAEENAYLERVKATKNDSLRIAEVVDDYHTKEKIENRKNRLAEAEGLRQRFKAYQESADGQFYLKTEEIIKAVDKLRREIKKVEDDNLKKQKKSEMEAKMQELVDLWKADERK